MPANDQAPHERPVPGWEHKPDYTALRFGPAPAERPYVIVNMVMSLDGKVTVEGTERGLGSPIDQRLMRELRVHADVVMNGAGTLRASGTSSRLDVELLERLRGRRGKSPRPISAVLSRSGDLPLERAFFAQPQEFEALVYLSEAAPADRRAAIEAAGRPVVTLPAGQEPRAALSHMRRELGAELLLVEGGPTLNGALFDQGLIDELFLTLGPVLVGGPAGLPILVTDEPASIGALERLELLQAHPNPVTGEVYLRYRLVSEAG